MAPSSQIKRYSSSGYSPLQHRNLKLTARSRKHGTRGMLVVHTTTCVMPATTTLLSLREHFHWWMKPRQRLVAHAVLKLNQTVTNTMQKIPLQGYSACFPWQLGPCPPQRTRPLSAPSPPSASPPAPARWRGSHCATDGGSDRTTSPAPGVG